MAKCPYCGSEISAVYFSTTCPSCSKALHSCRCCKFFSPSSHYGCRETVDEYVQDKERSNFCDYFRLSGEKVEQSGEEARKKALEMFDSLFSDVQ